MFFFFCEKSAMESNEIFIGDKQPLALLYRMHDSFPIINKFVIIDPV